MTASQSHGIAAGAVVVARVEDAPKAALQSMMRAGQRHLALVDHRGTFLGVVSAHAVAGARGPTLSVLVDSPALHVSPGSCIQEATTLMLAHGVDAVGVLDEDRAVIGILRWTDIIEMVGGLERP